MKTNKKGTNKEMKEQYDNTFIYKDDGGRRRGRRRRGRTDDGMGWDGGMKMGGKTIEYCHRSGVVLLHTPGYSNRLVHFHLSRHIRPSRYSWKRLTR